MSSGARATKNSLRMTDLEGTAVADEKPKDGRGKGRAEKCRGKEMVKRTRRKRREEIARTLSRRPTCDANSKGRTRLKGMEQRREEEGEKSVLDCRGCELDWRRL